MALLLGHAALLFMFLYDIIREYPAERLVAFDFLDRKQIFISLLVTGLLQPGHLGRQIRLWFNPLTSDAVIGPLRASILYDLPIFLAYLAIIPGMAVFWCASRPTSPSGTSGCSTPCAAARPCSTSASSRSR